MVVGVPGSSEEIFIPLDLKEGKEGRQGWEGRKGGKRP
jgi:hypothetical protein